ncbi:cytochrome C [Aliifodinibius salipaludis]|uniref:Cytochrome C n=1 Tax=Fodinibius salipaludis TaxID=2032627 RepID=A0A2A2G8W6_9BACT|nr:cytochrome c [Aliifodinibius salipaludis]PAU93283.1 cytochrome C [Aliifodinibius salipaludis]
MMNTQILKIAGLIVITVTLLIGCGESSDSEKDSTDSQEEKQELTDFEMRNGIGPVDEEITIDEIDPELAKEGMRIFDMKCGACHKLDSRYVGPPLGGVMNARTPAYVMNMILNPEEMLAKHPVAKSIGSEYPTRMTNQQLTREKARAVVEYLAQESQ